MCFKLHTYVPLINGCATNHVQFWKFTMNSTLVHEYLHNRVNGHVWLKLACKALASKKEEEDLESKKKKERREDTRYSIKRKRDCKIK